MKIILLTTETTHHCYFIKKIKKYVKNLYIFVETKKIKAPFKNFHSLDKKMIRFEKKKWFKRKKFRIKDNFHFYKFKNFNDNKAIKEIKKIKPNYIFSFGSGPLKKYFIKNFKNIIYNFHGGDSSKYRGLDSHLWSIYHGDVNSLSVVLHRLRLKLDTGEIVFKKNIPFSKIKNLYEIRSLNTNICISLFKKFLRTRRPALKKQKVMGRYYSYMPNVLKTEVERKFYNLKKR